MGHSRRSLLSGVIFIISIEGTNFICFSYFLIIFIILLAGNPSEINQISGSTKTKQLETTGKKAKITTSCSRNDYFGHFQQVVTSFDHMG